MKKSIAAMAAFAIMGGGYFISNTNCREMPRIAGLFKAVVLEEQVYERALLSDLSKTDNEAIAEEIIETGYVVRKRINSENEIAPGFVQAPYDLRILIEHTPQGDEAYLFSSMDGKKLPIFRNRQVGELGHRINGLEQSAENMMNDLFDEAKRDTMNALNGMFERFEQ